MKIIDAPKGLEAIGPYSLAIEHEGFIYTSGQIGKNLETGELHEGTQKQTEQVLANIERILQGAGSSREQVIKTTVFLANMEDYAVMNEVYGRFFGNHKPARSTVEVGRLPAGALVEIEVIAVK